MKLVMPMPVSEMWDRAQICAMKEEAMPDSPEVASWRDFSLLADKVQQPQKGEQHDLYNALWEANKAIWDTEDDIRTGASDLAWERDPAVACKIAHNCLKVRDLNRERCRIKGEINKIFGDCWGEAKHNYGAV